MNMIGLDIYILLGLELCKLLHIFTADRCTAAAVAPVDNRTNPNWHVIL
jgi:hypothetical protein